MAKKKASPDSTSAPPPATPVTRPRRAPAKRAPLRAAQPAEVSGTPPAAIDRASDSAAAGELPGVHSPSYEEIAEAAYHRFLQRGGSDGSDFDDWIAAERDLRRSRDRSTS